MWEAGKKVVRSAEIDRQLYYLSYESVFQAFDSWYSHTLHEEEKKGVGLMLYEVQTYVILMQGI